MSRRRMLVLAFLLLAAPARADRTMQEEIATLADDIKTHLKTATEVAVELFTGPAECNVEVQLRQALVQELKGRKIEVNKEARFMIRGVYKPVDLTDTKRLGVEVSCQIFDRKDDDKVPQFKLKAKLITDIADVVPAVGLTGVLLPGATEEERHKKLLEIVGEPSAHLDGNAIQADKASPYGVEVLVRDKARKPEVREGLAYVSIRKDELYAIRLVNKSAHEAAVTVTIDGLNVFAFSQLRTQNEKTKQLDYPPLLLPAGQSAELRGWPLNLKRSAEFKVTNYGESAVAELGGDRTKIGVITVQFAAAWKKGDNPPADERGKSVATGKGAEIDTPFQPVQRSVGAVRAFVSIRYTRDK